jgi:hypothetical protein
MLLLSDMLAAHPRPLHCREGGREGGIGGLHRPFGAIPVPIIHISIASVEIVLCGLDKVEDENALVR